MGLLELKKQGFFDKPPTYFQLRVKTAVDQGHTQELADKFEVAESTVKRWISGVAKPHPYLQTVILLYIDDNFRQPTLAKIGFEVFDGQAERGFHDPMPEDGTKVALIHSEVSEALEALRDPRYEPTDVWYQPDGKPEGVGIELGDVIMRVCEYATYRGIDLAKMIQLKHEYNKTRPKRHGGKRFG